jgi:hypothetical protein
VLVERVEPLPLLLASRLLASRVVSSRLLVALRTRGLALRLIVVLSILTSPTLAPASEHRSRAVAREFQREHPCPSTGQPTGPCPGYWRDHIIPLACGGPDTVANMQWQTVRDARAKDTWERKSCGR